MKCTRQTSWSTSDSLPLVAVGALVYAEVWPGGHVELLRLEKEDVDQIVHILPKLAQFLPGQPKRIGRRSSQGDMLVDLCDSTRTPPWDILRTCNLLASGLVPEVSDERTLLNCNLACGWELSLTWASCII